MCGERTTASEKDIQQPKTIHTIFKCLFDERLKHIFFLILRYNHGLGRYIELEQRITQ